jgi:hypothetical protein
MSRHEFPIVALAALLGLAASASAEPSSDYGKVDTFQPGKKYNCVPTADRKGWDCNATGKAEVPPTPEPTPAPAPARTPVAAPAPAPAHEAVPAAPATQSTPHASALPGYLTNAGAREAMQPMPAAPAPKPAPPPRVKGPLVPAQTSIAPVANPPPVKPAAAAPKPAAAATAPSVPAGHDFLALPAAEYVIELAHADSAAGLGTAPHSAHGEVYELHLSQGGSESWLLLWGPFTDLPSARAARDELAAQGATPGWPRRIGPLQTEVRRSQP